MPTGDKDCCVILAIFHIIFDKIGDTFWTVKLRFIFSVDFFDVVIVLWHCPLLDFYSLPGWGKNIYRKPCFFKMQQRHHHLNRMIASLKLLIICHGHVLPLGADHQDFFVAPIWRFVLAMIVVGFVRRCQFKRSFRRGISAIFGFLRL